MKNTAHFILQGKGGVGKSLIASMIAQYLQQSGYKPACADTDPINSTFFKLKALDVAQVQIAENGVIVQRLFDPLFMTVIESKVPVVIDNGTSTFMPMLRYMHTNEAFKILEEQGKQVIVHAVVVGGEAKEETLNGLRAMLKMVSGTGTKVVVWQNEFWGVPMMDDGRPLETLAELQSNPNFAGIVRIIDRNDDATKTDFKLMTERHLTLAEVKVSEQFVLWAKSRIQRVYNDVFAELDAVFKQATAEAA